MRFLHSMFWLMLAVMGLLVLGANVERINVALAIRHNNGEVTVYPGILIPTPHVDELAIVDDQLHLREPPPDARKEWKQSWKAVQRISEQYNGRY